MKETKLSGFLQENILTLLVFSDKYCKLIRHNISSNLFESAVYREIVDHAIIFIDQFNEAPKDHIADSLEDILNSKDQRKAKSYSRVLENLYSTKDSINGDYVLSKLHDFIRQQNLKSALIKAVESVEAGNLDEAEVELQKGLQRQINIFEAGTLFSNPAQSLKFFDEVDDGIPTGIEELDSKGICLRPKELMLFIASPKKGKSWWITQLGKNALLDRKKVLIITLEMSEERYSQRFIQSMFSISKRDAKIKIATFKKDSLNRLIGIEDEFIERPTLQQDNIKSYISNKLKTDFVKRPKLMIKNFPTGTLTINMLKAYLDGLERFDKFTPDVLLIDYPDLMKIRSDNYRHEMGTIFKDIRGIGVERNIAIGAVTQGNRSAVKSKQVTEDMVGEDFSKIATADNVITYSQTEAEKSVGLARLYVSNARSDEDKFTILISQAYSIGQFCLNSTLMLNDYWNLLNRATNKNEEEEDE